MKRWWLALLLLALLGASSVPGALADDAKTPAEDAAHPDKPPAKELRSGEKFEFKAEVNRLMNIIIHSLYSNKDIFLRELISNASDALDKIRLLGLSEPSSLGSGTAANLEIRMEVDSDKNILKLRDRGVGMTKDELVKNLGTIAKSGTSAFLEKMQQGGDLNLIGQFGVGFYSVYLVSDYVEVISKSNDDVQHIWESNAGGQFVISEDKDGSVSGEGDLERGTMIRIHLKDESMEYAQEEKLKGLVQKYSEFINFPIYLLTSKEVEVENEPEAETDSESKDEITDDDEEKTQETPQKQYETVVDWELLNGNKAIWLRDPKDVEAEEYDKFYSALSKGDSGALSHAHFKAEGDVEFRSILFIPPKAPWDFYDNYYSRKAAVKLYVRRVFISDEFDDLLPKYLSWLLGLVDSDTLPLNVSREMLQQHSSLRTIKKKLVRKALDMIKNLSAAAAKAKKRIAKEDGTDKDTPVATAGGDDEDDESDSAPFDREAAEADVQKYETLWTEFGRALKLGIMEDANNRGRLAKLIRFYTTASPDKLASLDEYLARMKEGQKAIYFICGSSMDEVQKSPFLEQLIEQGYEVILFVEPMDEYMMQNLLDYEDVKFQNAAKEDLKLGDEEANKKLEKKLRTQFKPLTKWWKKLVGEEGNLEAVRVSNRLSSTPCVVVTSKYGWSANMQRIMQAQALGDAQRQAYMQGKKTIEINPRHPLIVGLLEKVQVDEEDESAKDTAKLLFETALLESGYPMQDNQAFAGRVYELMKEQLGVARDLKDLHPEVQLDASDEEPAPKSQDTADAAAAAADAGAAASDDHDEL